MVKLDCPECGGHLFLMAMKKNKASWRCCTRPTHVFEMDGDSSLVRVTVGEPDTDDRRSRLADALRAGCSDDADLLRRLGDL